jgi:hypothetical protein
MLRQLTTEKIVAMADGRICSAAPKILVNAVNDPGKKRDI